MSPSVRILLDEDVGQVFQQVLRDRGYRVEQAKDRFGEHTVDEELRRWSLTRTIPKERSPEWVNYKPGKGQL